MRRRAAATSSACTPGAACGCCPPPELPRSASLRQIVAHYIRYVRPYTKAELRRFRRQPSLPAAVELAASCTNEDDLRHSHQRRIPRRALRAMQERFASVHLLRCSSFDDLHATIEAATDDIDGIGRLTVYDVATRIGAYLGHAPKVIYLHAGTRDGARALGLDVRRRDSIERSELPAEFRRLTAAECEDVLCIYKDRFPAALRRSRRSAKRRRRVA